GLGSARPVLIVPRHRPPHLQPQDTAKSPRQVRNRAPPGASPPPALSRGPCLSGPQPILPPFNSGPPSGGPGGTTERSTLPEFQPPVSQSFGHVENRMKIYVGNLSFNTTEDVLRSTF